jgi:magnesium-transporting ATPase (P-type)
MICILNDAATLVIAIDNARVSKRPDKWRLGQLMMLGFLLCVISFGHFFVAKFVYEVERKQLQTIMFLQISSCPHFVIFSTRVSTYFWKNTPSVMFVLAILGTQLVAMVMSVYGLDVFEAYPMYVVLHLLTL